MSETPENPTDAATGTPTLDDVIEPTEQAIPDRHEHGKMPAHPNDEELERRTEHERVELGLADYDPNEIPSATE